MREIHQLVHTLSYGDAISSEVLSLKRSFERLGCKSTIYALNIHPKLKQEATFVESFPADFSGEVVLHYSLGSPLNSLYSSLNQASRYLIYHNITPPFWFEGVNPRIVRDIKNGLDELPELLAITDGIISDSDFNAQELLKLGFESAVLQLPVDPVRWHEPANEGIKKLLTSDDTLHFLHVGRLAPNKCLEDIIRTFYFLHHKIEPKSKLWLVGVDTDTELYSFALRYLAQELGLDDAIEFVGCMSDCEVRALYEGASVYICMSEHEGFCLPPLEAMHFSLPVVAYASSAIPQTVGEGGILIDHKDPALVAELLYKVATDSDLRAALISAGKKRVDQLSLERFEKQVIEMFNRHSSDLGTIRSEARV